MTIKHLDHLNLTAANLEESLQWYRDVFGFEVVEKGDRLCTTRQVLDAQEWNQDGENQAASNHFRTPLS